MERAIEGKVSKLLTMLDRALKSYKRTPGDDLYTTTTSEYLKYRAGKSEN